MVAIRERNVGDKAGKWWPYESGIVEIREGNGSDNGGGMVTIREGELWWYWKGMRAIKSIIEYSIIRRYTNIVYFIIIVYYYNDGDM